MLQQALFTLAYDKTTPLGQMAKTVILDTVTAEDLYKVYHYFNQFSLTGWDLIFMAGDVDILEKAKPMAQDPIQLSRPFPPLTDDNALLIIELWLILTNTNPQRGLTQVLKNHNPTAKTIELILTFLEKKPISVDCLQQLAVWRLETKLSKAITKRADAFFQTVFQTTTHATELAEHLIVKRRMPHAIAWVVWIGKGKGMNFTVPTSIPVNALYNKAIEKLATNHGRMTLIATISQCGPLHSSQDMNTALKMGIAA